MGFIYLEVEDVERIHDKLLLRHGGLPGREAGKLEGVLGIPMSGFGDFERYPTVYEKAAAYHYYLASGHCFQDGNKRTATASMHTFLLWNDYRLIADPHELFVWTLKIANHETRPDFEDAVYWIQKNTITEQDYQDYLERSRRQQEIKRRKELGSIPDYD